MKCATCDRPVHWDDYHRPSAWRHEETGSRWCSLDYVPELGPMAHPERIDQ